MTYQAVPLQRALLFFLSIIAKSVNMLNAIGPFCDLFGDPT